MDIVLDICNTLILDPLYSSLRSELQSATCNDFDDSGLGAISSTIIRPSQSKLCSLALDDTLWDPRSIYRQSTSVFMITLLTSIPAYLILGALCYAWNFDIRWKSNVKYHKNQIKLEIADSLWALLWLNILTVPIFIAQLRGYSRMYIHGTADWRYELLQYPLFILFSDCSMYWLHRMFHIPFLFRWMHKHHHNFVIPTPFAAHAFHPLEAFIMSLPIYAYSFVLPMSNLAQLLVFLLSFVWTFLLHDNRDQFHTVHHKNTNYNFGQFFTLFDRLGGTYWDEHDFFVNKVRGDRKTVQGLKPGA